MGAIHYPHLASPWKGEGLAGVCGFNFVATSMRLLPLSEGGWVGVLAP